MNTPRLTEDLPLASYCYAKGLHYATGYRWILRGKLAGYRDECGRWRVVVAADETNGLRLDRTGTRRRRGSTSSHQED